jgi:hypothetical protein
MGKEKEASRPWRWLSLPVAATHLGASPDALRRMLERRAVRAPDGCTEAEVDGVRGRKLGKLWKVRLSAAWGEADGDT